MLILREQQLKVFREQQVERFYQRAIAELRNELPESCACVNDAVLLKHVKAGTEKAHSLGLFDPLDIIRFLKVFITVGVDFECNQDCEWISEIVDNHDLLVCEKLDQLEIGLADWEQTDDF